MKTVKLRELLTAAVDGELTPAERRAVQRALRESEAARNLFAKLKSDSVRLKAVSRVPAPLDLSENVLSMIQDRAMTPTPLPPSPQPSRKFNWSMLPVWVNLATAAAILVVVSFGSYSYFTASQDFYVNRDKDSVGRAPDPQLPRLRDPGELAKGTEPKTPEDVDPLPKGLVRVPSEIVPQLGPQPRVVSPDLYTGPLLNQGMPEIESIQLDKIRVSSLFGLNELTNDAEARKKLVGEMKKDELTRLDLFCATTGTAIDRVLAALKARGVNVVSDSFVVERLKRKLPTEIVVFTEAMTADEVAQFLAAIGAEDQKTPAQEFTTLVAAPFLPADLNMLGRLLGIPNVLPKPVQGKKPIDVSKPLPEGTALHLAASLSKMGNRSQTPAKAEKIAIVAAYSPMNAHPGNSKEIKQFLDRRGERKPDAKPLMLVLRTIK